MRPVGAVAAVWLAAASLAACATTASSTRAPVAPGFLAEASTTTTAPAVTAPAWVAAATVPLLGVYLARGAARPVGYLANPNPLGATLVLLVAQTGPDWLHVYLPQRPNGANGWIRRSDVTLIPCYAHLVVSLRARLLALYVNNAAVFVAPVAVGSPTDPTPTGHFFVTELLKLTDPGDAYGPYAFGLSGFSNTLFAFDGGPGQIAIHGTNQPWVIGGYASHGCIRMTNSAITQLFPMVPAGTPVDIVA